MNVHQAREGHFNPASPHSSSGAADSFKGTPDTRLTTFSPEDGSARSTRAPGSLNASIREAGPIKYGMSAPQSIDRSSIVYRSNLHLDKDPFVGPTDTSFKARQKLSPTASVFSPLPSAMPARGSASEPKRMDAFSENLSQHYAQTSRLSSPSANAPHSNFLHDKLSTDSGISRCLVISTTNGNRLTGTEVELYLSELQQAGIPFQGNMRVCECGDQVFVQFSNIRSACTVFSNLTMRTYNWTVRSVSPREFSSVVEPGAGSVTAHEGQLYLSLFPHLPSRITTLQLESFLKELLQSEGDLFAFKIRDGVQGSLISALVEYCDNDMSLRAVSKFNNAVVEGFQICITLYRPDLRPITAPSGTNGSARAVVSPTQLATGFRRMSIGRTPSVIPTATNSLYSTPARHSISQSGFQLPSPYGVVPLLYTGLPITPPYMMDQSSPRTPSSMLSASNYSLASPTLSQHSSFLSTDLMTPRQFQNFGRSDGRRQNAMRIARSPYYNPANHHNHVDVSRIRDGIDVRTTIMLRNIPNKVDQALLKKIVDESSWGKYDFMYLRIDFANDCNVGYAFINFVDFVHARANQRWNCFKSDKVAEVSYATIQGKDCLVQKFRNSSVMLEAPHYRPKLFYTLNGPHPELAGEEEPFPEPDNQSKMKRSCENAEHVGLFTPNAGQHFRDEQRRRRSQFDRGNPRLEEYDYDTAICRQSYYPSQ
ncbi:RNA recognition motif 2-domain-containing protein [Daldinia caldariorum]|uniref:RNA recognition motif 2-domain-containing protein n=1 Tax=Daldinia caldariorum TaxID=326644 RepID=UPI0020078561|nr:RNA recognition motif 2-domain-containing protein [Daldinia caldariorum]KAI1464745.1 RNA recognition motif 2-domain-containing protein [Daldinia caldariorum]